MIPILTNENNNGSDISHRLEVEEEKEKELKLNSYYQAFLKHYNDIHWSGMNISKILVAEILGIDPQASNEKDVFFKSKPMTMTRKAILSEYVTLHESQIGSEYTNS